MEVDHSKDGESHVAYTVAVLTIACVLSTTVVMLRLFTRICILNTFGADDAVMAFAQVLTLGAAASIYLGKSARSWPGIDRVDQDRTLGIIG